MPFESLDRTVLEGLFFFDCFAVLLVVFGVFFFAALGAVAEAFDAFDFVVVGSVDCGSGSASLFLDDRVTRV